MKFEPIPGTNRHIDQSKLYVINSLFLGKHVATKRTMDANGLVTICAADISEPFDTFAAAVAWCEARKYKEDGNEQL